MKNEPEAMRMNANVPERVLREIVSFARRHQIEKVIPVSHTHLTLPTT